LRGAGFGDLFIETVVETPTNLTEPPLTFVSSFGFGQTDPQ